MQVKLPKGKYILAVSGGEDSMVLLNMLSKMPELDLVVAHFDHGIRPSSTTDEAFVRTAVYRLGLVYESAVGGLGPNASEETARKARYDFLNLVKDKYGAIAIVTAHHQDDLIETAILNILRGTGPRGLVAMQKNKEIIRPLLGMSKKEIVSYAKAHKINWREDPTNQAQDYLRNYVRLNITPKLSAGQKKTVLGNIDKISQNHELKQQLTATLLQNISEAGLINRVKFSLLPQTVGNELIVHWLRDLGWRDFDRTEVNKINTLIKVGAVGNRHNLNKKLDLTLTKNEARIETVRFERT